jgi:hypothetical protein
MTTWTPYGNNKLVATVPIPNLEEAQKYQSFLQRWQTLVHPAILDIDESQTSAKELDGKNVLEAIILSKKLSQFKPSKTIISSLSTFEKLFLVKQTIALDLYADLNCSWEMSHLYLHQSGLCGWLPPLPSQQLRRGKEEIIRFLFELFEIEIGEISHWRNLQQEGKIPWEWGAFIEKYLADEEFDILKVFSFIFYQSWLYTTANRLGMKDKVLNKKDHEILYQFGISLGLDDEKIQKLNIIAQQQHPDWKDLIAMVGA